MEPQAENQQAPIDSEEKDISTKAADVDYFLQMEVDEANSSLDPYMGITLQVHGLVISGTLISGDRYFNTLASKIKEEGEAADSARKFYRELGDRYRESRDPENPFKLDPPSFIHLEDASIVSVPGMSQLKSLWRGRISSVDGWFRGIPVSNPAN
jgi:hypothetical protein